MTLSSQFRQVLWQKRLVAYIFSAFLSNTGTWVQRLAMGWLVYAETSSIAWVGAVAACEVLPAIVLQPVGGVLLDRMPRPKVLALGSVAAFGQAASLALFHACGLLNLPVLMVAAVLLGLLEGINQPARLTIIAEFSQRDTLRAAISFNSLSFNLARFIGPLIASLILSRDSATLAFAVNAASFLPIIVTLLLFSPVAQALGPISTGSWSGAFLSGLRYIWRHDLLRTLFSVAIVVNLSCRSLIELLPAISGQWFDNDPGSLAVLTSAVAFGAMLGGLWLLTRRDAVAILASVLSMWIVTCISAMGIALAGGNLVVTVAACVGIGFSASSAAVGMQNLVHHSVAPSHLGRVMAVYGLVQRGGAALGAVLLGAAGDKLGLSGAVFAGACVALVVTMVGRRRRPVLERHLRHLEKAP